METHNAIFLDFYDTVQRPAGNEAKCTMSTCWNYTRCPLAEKFSVYFYHLKIAGGTIVSDNSSEAVRNYMTSRYRTLYKSRACAFGVLITFVSSSSVPLLHIRPSILQQTLHSLPTWGDEKTGGTNHVIITLVSTGYDPTYIFDGVSIGNAIIAKPSFCDYQFSHGFDIVTLPTRGELGMESWKEMPMMVPVKRKNLGYFQGEYHPSQIWGSDTTSRFLIVFRNVLGSQYKTDFHVEFTCKDKFISVNDEWQLCGPAVNRQELLSQSTFSVIPAPSNNSILSTHFTQVRLYEVCVN